MLAVYAYVNLVVIVAIKCVYLDHPMILGEWKYKVGGLWSYYIPMYIDSVHDQPSHMTTAGVRTWRFVGNELLSWNLPNMDTIGTLGHYRSAIFNLYNII